MRGFEEREDNADERRGRVMLGMATQIVDHDASRHASPPDG